MSLFCPLSPNSTRGSPKKELLSQSPSGSLQGKSRILTANQEPNYLAQPWCRPGLTSILPSSSQMSSSVLPGPAECPPGPRPGMRTPTGKYLCIPRAGDERAMCVPRTRKACMEGAPAGDGQVAPEKHGAWRQRGEAEGLETVVLAPCPGPALTPLGMAVQGASDGRAPQRVKFRMPSIARRHPFPPKPWGCHCPEKRDGRCSEVMK